MQFTDSLSENTEVVRELLAGVPADARNRAKRAAIAIENTWNKLKKDYPRDPAVALGAAFAIFKLAEMITSDEREAQREGKGLIVTLDDPRR